MSNALLVSCTLDSFWFRESDKRIFVVAGFYDDFIDMQQHVSVDVTDELQEIYQGVEFDKEFVKKIEKKLKLSLKNNSITLSYAGEYNWKLDKSLKELYSPVQLTPDKVKFGDPLVLNATILGFKRQREGKNFPMAGLLAQCIIGNQSIVSCNDSDKVQIDVLDKQECQDTMDTEIVYVDVDSEFDFIYNELKSNKCSRERFVGESGKLYKREEIYNRIAKMLIGKKITLEYDEHFGYSVWDLLVYAIDKNYR